jgi:hypothetical protein
MHLRFRSLRLHADRSLDGFIGCGKAIMSHQYGLIMQIGLHFGQEICRTCRSSAINSCTSKHKTFMIGRSPPLPSLANMSSIDAQKQKLQTALQAFDAIIKALPKTLSAGDKNGPIAANFTSHKFDSDEGPYRALHNTLQFRFRDFLFGCVCQSQL